MKKIISAIDVQPLDFHVGDPVGTPIAIARVELQPLASFTGRVTLTVPTGYNKADWQLPHANPDGSFTLSCSLVVPAGWAPQINLIASQAGYTNLWAGPFLFEPTAVAPPPSVSPDGTIITAPTTSQVVNADGVWSFGPTVARTSGSVPGYSVLRNGVATGAVGAKLEVAGGGVLYLYDDFNTWYVFSHVAGTFSQSAPPPTPSVLTVTLAYQFIAYTDPITRVSYQLGYYPTTVPAGTHVAKLTATRSDAQPFTGTLAFATVNGVIQNYSGAYDLVMNADHTADVFIADPSKLGPASMASSVTEHIQVVATQP